MPNLVLVFLACAPEPPVPPPSPTTEALPPITVDPLPDGEGVRIAVSFADRAMQRFTVRTTRACPASGSAEWWMANWTPGSYMIRDHAGHVETIRASSGAIAQTAKNRWSVSCEAGSSVTVETSLLATERNVRGNYIADSWASLNPPAAFLLPDPPVGPFDVAIDLPEEWPDAVVPLPVVAGASSTWRAADVDTLIDSPMVVGDVTTDTLTVSGVPHHFVTFGDQRTFDREVLTTSVVDLIEAQHAFWGDVPYPEYWFLQALLPTYGGLEHYQSTLMMATPNATETREDTIRWLGLVSHEFFHAWNVQRLRPRSLVAQDYETEAHTELLWVAEGWTSYYDDLLLARAGIIEEAEYVELLSAQIDRLESRPGRHVQSVAQSSFNAWTKFYRSNPHQLNSTISYYTKGAVVAFLLDAAIRRATQDRASLDDVARSLRTLSESAPEAPLAPRLQSMGARRAIRGITPDDVRQTAARVAGRNLDAFFDGAVNGTDALDYGGAMQWFGLTLDREAPRPRLGLRTSIRDGRIVVGGVLRDGPAWRAGLHVGDEILALDGERAESDLGGIVERCADRACELVRSREGRVETLRITPEVLPGSITVAVDEGASPLARRRRRTWLGQ
ncbi:MAG: PDZ domain-containing protein [Myxococcota bacterium]